MYTLSEEENMILTMVDGLCADIVSEGAADIDVADEFPEEYYNLVKEQGLIGLAMPEEFGGFAVSMHCWAKSAARMAQELPALGLTAFLPLVASHALVAYGTDEQKQRYMPEIIMGEKKISFAVTEPNAGSDIWNLTTKAVPEGDGYVLTGNKQFISNAAVADYMIAIIEYVCGERGERPQCPWLKEIEA
jgi:alkylation response protein AidB-like acyl-CoA dehydrogenase